MESVDASIEACYLILCRGAEENSVIVYVLDPSSSFEMTKSWEERQYSSRSGVRSFLRLKRCLPPSSVRHHQATARTQATRSYTGLQNTHR